MLLFLLLNYRQIKNLLSGLIEFKEMLTIEFVESRNLEISVKFTFA
jgi:hypothetical protein